MGIRDAVRIEMLLAMAAALSVGAGHAAVAADDSGSSTNASAASSASAATATAATDSQQGASGGDQLQEVVVTAERRAEDPQKMAVSVVAFNTDELRDKGIDDVADLQAQVPSLSFVDTGNTKYINIRGIGLNESAPNQTDGVASYLDGAYIAREFTSDDAYFDVQSVSVLRGPQGTYVGQNATGGAIFVNTNAPSLSRMEGYAQQTFGTYDYRDTEGALSLPLSDTFAMRTSVLSESRNSFTNNLGPFGHPGDLQRNQSARQPQPADRARAAALAAEQRALAARDLSEQLTPQRRHRHPAEYA